MIENGLNYVSFYYYRYIIKIISFKNYDPNPSLFLVRRRSWFELYFLVFGSDTKSSNRVFVIRQDKGRNGPQEGRICQEIIFCMKGLAKRETSAIGEM